VAPAVVAAGPAATALLEQLAEVHARCLQRGDEAEEQTRGDRDREREREHTHIDRVVAQQVRELLWDDHREQANAAEGQREAEGAADEGEHQVLRQQLRHQAPAAGAGGRTDREFLLPGRAGSEQHVGDVGTRDQQHEADGPEQKAQAAAAPPK